MLTTLITRNSASKCFGGEVSFNEIQSAACNTKMRFSVFMPPQAATPDTSATAAAATSPASKASKTPAVFFLSGLTCTEENFMIKAGAQRIAAQLGLALIVPDTSPRQSRVPGDDATWDLGLGAGFYLDATESPWAPHYQMGTFVAQELPDAVAAHFPVDPERFGIMGHSMGGHGAIVNCLRNPDRFKSCSALAPISAPSSCPWGRKAFRAYLGENPEAWRAWDSCELMQDASLRGKNSKKIPILVDQGDADPWLQQLRPDLLAEAANKSDWPITMHMRAGYDHGYYFVASFIEDHLKHHARQLGLAF